MMESEGPTIKSFISREERIWKSVELFAHVIRLASFVLYANKVVVAELKCSFFDGGCLRMRVKSGLNE